MAAVEEEKLNMGGAGTEESQITNKQKPYPGESGYFLRMFNDPLHSDFQIICNEKKFFVHKVFICNCSYFQAACNPENFKEGQDHRLEVRETDHGVVYAALVFLYCGTYDTVAEALYAQDSRLSFGLAFHADVYILAEMWGVHGLRELAFRKMCKWLKDMSGTQTFARHMMPVTKTIFSKTPETDRNVRKLFSDYIYQEMELIFRKCERRDSRKNNLEIFQNLPTLVMSVSLKTLKAAPKSNQGEDVEADSAVDSDDGTDSDNENDDDDDDDEGHDEDLDSGSGSDSDSEDDSDDSDEHTFGLDFVESLRGQKRKLAQFISDCDPK